jgi:hypothetical protein
MRLILLAKDKEARTKHTGAAIHMRLRAIHKEGMTLLTFVWGKLYNGKLGQRNGHAPTDDCPLCGLPDSCTHIDREFKENKANFTSQHNAACQFIHATIRKATKVSGALHIAPDLALVTADAGTQPQLTEEITEFLYSTQLSDDEHPTRE